MNIKKLKSRKFLLTLFGSIFTAAMTQVGLDSETAADRQAVEALVVGSNDQNTIDGWQHASTFKATNPLFQGAVAYLGWSQDKVDALLIRASQFD